MRSTKVAAAPPPVCYCHFTVSRRSAHTCNFLDLQLCSVHIMSQKRSLSATTIPSNRRTEDYIIVYETRGSKVVLRKIITMRWWYRRWHNIHKFSMSNYSMCIYTIHGSVLLLYKTWDLIEKRQENQSISFLGFMLVSNFTRQWRW